MKKLLFYKSSPLAHVRAKGEAQRALMKYLQVRYFVKSEKREENYLSDHLLHLSEENLKQEFLNRGSKNIIEFKELLDSIYLNYKKDFSNETLMEGQIKLEEMCIKHEYDFFHSQINSLKYDNILKEGLKFTTIQFNVMLDWEYKIYNALDKYIHKYTINNYRELLKEIKKGSEKGKLVLLILSFIKSREDNKKMKQFISILLTIIFRLLNNNDEPVKKVNLVMDVINQLLLRAPLKLELFIEEKDILLENYYVNNILHMAEDSKGVLGLTLFDLILDNVEGLNQIQGSYDSKDKKKYNYISIKDNYRELLMKKCISPLILPMISKPKEWEFDNHKGKYVNGGYFTSEMRRIVQSGIDFVKQNFKNEEDSKVGKLQEESINYLNGQKFRINKQMLSLLIKEFNSENSFIFKKYNKLHPSTESMDKLNKKDKLIKEIMSHNSIYFLNKSILEIAIIFENFTFYLPCFMDFRGRIYPYVYFMNYQGSDIARSLIEFVDGCEIDDNSINIIYQYLANTAGKSKLTLQGKINWAKTFLNENFKAISFENNSFTTNLDDFRNKIIELLNLKYNSNNKSYYDIDEIAQFSSILLFLIHLREYPKLICHTPILFDATCSGMQHLSALLSDINLGKMSNVIGNDDNIPFDVYTEVGKKVKESIDNLSDLKERDNLSKIEISRGLMKKPVMTVPYNVSYRTMSEQLINEGFFTKEIDTLSKGKIYFYLVNPKIVKNNEKLYLFPSELQLFCKLLYNSVDSVVPTLKDFKDYFNQMMDVILKINKPIVWTTPTGMIISLSSRKFESYTSKSLFRKGNTITISLPTTSLSNRDIKRSFIPNFIHSMDASNIQQLILRLKDYENIPLYTIHDCFATTPKNMNIINKEIKLAFIDLYFNQNYLQNMHKNFIQQINSYTTVFEDKLINENNINYVIIDNRKIVIPNLPPFIMWNEVKGKFIEGIKKSNYFIN